MTNPHEPTTAYRPPFPVASLFLLLAATNRLVNAVHWNDYAVVVLFISAFVLYFMLRSKLMKFLSLRNHFGLRVKLMVDLEIWLAVAYSTFMFFAVNNNFADFDIWIVRLAVTYSTYMFFAVNNNFASYPLGVKWVLVASFLTGTMLSISFMMSLFVISDLFECWWMWRNGEDGEQKVAAGNVKKNL